MIYLDTTSASSWRHPSGLARVSRRLAAELGTAALAAVWPAVGLGLRPEDWVLTPELFSEPERPGLTAFLARRPCRVAAIYHDAIPLKHPDITWPKSVERHPAYMKLLAQFDRVWAVSEASRQELLNFWRWQGVTSPPTVEVLTLGADGAGVPRAGGAPGIPATPARIVSVGILEPRKNQAVLMDAYEVLRREGLVFELHLVGRVNPHFGSPLAARAARIAADLPGLHHHRALTDGEVAGLIATARATAFPSIAEGCGLPVLESLWQGVPCRCSDIAPVLENARGGGCVAVEGNRRESWIRALRRVITDDEHRRALAATAAARPLPPWLDAATVLRRALA